MIPQGSMLLNTTQMQASVSRINNCGTCADLQQAVNDAMNSLHATKAAITAQLALLTPLIVAPTDLGSVITWVNKMIATFHNPIINYTAQLTALATEVSTMISAISTKAGSFTGCSISIPSV